MTLRSEPGPPLSGRTRVTPDKSMTHRAVLLGAIAKGVSRIARPNSGGDCRATAEAARALGAKTRLTDEEWVIEGCEGIFQEPDHVLDMGNSGTGIRLLAGLLSTQPFLAILTGDLSLRSRPMSRVADPLRAMGATILSRKGGRAPLAILGGRCHPISYEMPVASAQVKSALLLAGLGAAPGELVVTEPGPARDHTERLLKYLGVPIFVEGSRIKLKTPAAIPSFEWTIPGDPSAAAFYIVAALIAPGSELVLEDVALNPRRIGFLNVLRQMGAAIEISPRGEQEPEPRGDITVKHCGLKGITVPGEAAVTFIDEVPVLSVAAAFAEGETVFQGLDELRHKESDRLATTAKMIRDLGGAVEETADGLTLHGGAGGLRGGVVESFNDHRIAMSGLVAGCAARESVTVHGGESISTSDPAFIETLAGLRSIPQ
ncbi:MAG: 3-phosphoshikimate 1-carboxyvinyltransferase [Candidatus Eisenbacteria bacterium]|uniref:3-phosphoshikimate 1-carboxyvinyltransferase n=1 Tax=Eiseniibacteriota bacterium TaxID=2212470 RepID=A0A948RUF6_UNCEI|nr:3-phosphoshikimate 1-carboxyvinyltransferase [Candidatus Eisenbacteria bacterium]MBU1947160.1 3-phosphoshikimate 1-carboxyvinyltransferase [Candidatus Eisenbacteria bacterium]MBU2691220.1 3-phosphoshikimate 1-carboxyvinyltransferase [Candidatus Eisenbacteria bacterium]